MAEQRRIGFHWHLRRVMAAHNLWKSTELRPLLRSRGINLSDAQVYRLVTGEPQRIPSRTFAALCDIFDCTPNELFEPYVEMQAAASANAPQPTRSRSNAGKPSSQADSNRPGRRWHAPANLKIRSAGRSHAPDAKVITNRWPPGLTDRSASTATKRPNEQPESAPAGTKACCPASSMIGPPAGGAAASGSTSTASAAAPRPNSTAADDANVACSNTTAQRLLTDPDTGLIAPQLQIIVDALAAMHRPNSGLTWIRQAHVQSVLRELARHRRSPMTCSTTCQQGRTTNYMRSLLVEHAALPSRDERLARFQTWAVTAQQRITTDEHRKVVARFIRWNLEKRLRSMNVVTDSAFLRAKQALTVTIEFCNWLAAEHDTTVEHLTQAHIDLWQATGPTTREHVLRFIRWAIKAKLIASDLEVTPHRRGTAPRMSIDQQNAVIEKVAHQQTLHPRDRLAAILIIVFAQRAEDVAALTWKQITITADTVTIDLAGHADRSPASAG